MDLISVLRSFTFEFHQIFTHMFANMKYRALGGALFHHLKKHKCPILHHRECCPKKGALKSVLVPYMVPKNSFLVPYFRACVGNALRNQQCMTYMHQGKYQSYLVWQQDIKRVLMQKIQH
jgi:hypothetical protein